MDGRAGGTGRDGTGTDGHGRTTTTTAGRTERACVVRKGFLFLYFLGKCTCDTRENASAVRCGRAASFFCAL